MKTCGGEDVWMHVSLISALVGGEWSHSAVLPWEPNGYEVGWASTGLDDVK
jgi:hypothetical protein